MYRKLCSGCDKAISFLVAVLMVIMVVAIFCQVLFRYVLHLPLFWTEELSRYCMVFTVYLGCVLGIRRDSHLGFTFLVDHCSPKVQKVMKTMQYIGILALNVFITYYGIMLSARNTYQKTPALQVSMWLIYTILPISGVMSIMQVILKMIDVIKAEEPEEGGANA